MNFETLKKILTYLSIAFVVISVWTDPQGSVSAAENFLNSVGGFCSTAITKGTVFLKNLAT